MPDSGPLLSPTTAFLLCGFFTLSYVVSLYLASAGRLVFRAPPVNVPNGQERVRLANEQWRNDPSVIKARLRAVTISTLLSMLTVGFVVIQTAKGSMSTVSAYSHFHGLGLTIQHSNRSFKVCY